MGDADQDELAEPETLKGQLLAERYRVEELIGQGGMGAVYRATHVHMQKPVAIKLLHREMTLNDEARQRFEREAVVSARIEHPHVTGAKDFGKLEDGTCYLVLDYVSGESLKALLKRERPLSTGRTVNIVRQIALALQAAHSAGVIHRDLKPDNIMLVEHQGDPDFVKVLDFGIAKLESRNTGNTVQLTQAGAVFGTPEYMSPEQAAGKVADARSDLYTIGIMLFEMLAGHTPFRGETIVAILTQHLTAEPPELSESVPAPLQRIVKKLLKKEPGLRFQDAGELLQALDAIGSADASGEATTIPAPALRSAADETMPSSAERYVVSARTFLTETALPQVRQWASSPVRLGSRTIALWVPAAASFGVGLVLVLLLWTSGPPSPGGSAPGGGLTKDEVAADEAQPIDLDAARRGDPEALDSLEDTPAEERSNPQWAALIEGRFNAARPKAALDTIQRALAQSPELKSDEGVVAVVHALALSDAHHEQALPLLAQSFGALGADLLDELSADRELGKRLGPAFVKRLKSATEKSLTHASPALKLKLELEQAKGCKAVKDLLPRAIKVGDDRSSKELQKRTARRGCGFLGLSDCYSCLRGDQQLADAIAAVKERLAPKPPAPALPPKVVATSSASQSSTSAQ